MFYFYNVFVLLYCKSTFEYPLTDLDLPCSRVKGKPTSYSIFPITFGEEAANIEEVFDLLAEFRERHFIVACEMNCVREVFHQVIRITFYKMCI